jgi:hypothetical protein
MEANPDFKRGVTPILTTDFLSRIENADPNAPDTSEDNSGPGWGHHQFTSGNMTITTVLKSWDCVGSTEIACKLIAVTIKTCQVARHLCFEKGLNPNSYLSDVYLQNLVEVLWTIWNNAGGVSLIASLISNPMIMFETVQPATTVTASTTTPTAPGPESDNRPSTPQLPSSPVQPPPLSPAASTFLSASGATASAANSMVLDQLDHLSTLSSVSAPAAAGTILEPPNTMGDTGINVHMGKEATTGLHVSPSKTFIILNLISPLLATYDGGDEGLDQGQENPHCVNQQAAKGWQVVLCNPPHRY